MTYATIHTFKFILLFTLIGVAFFIFMIPKAGAYFTTAQKEIDLGNGTGLFLIEYKFGMNKYEVHMPVFAQQGTEKSNSMVSYEIMNEDDEVVSGKAVGIVLSSTPVSEQLTYVTPKGSSKTFVLAVFFTPETRSETEKYRLQVTHLPFQFDGKQQLQLNPSELKYYTTNLISL